MGKKFWLTWLGVVWVSGCGGDSSLGSGRDNESKLSSKDGAGEEETDEAAAAAGDPEDSSDDDSTDGTDEHDGGVEGSVPSNDDDDTSADDDEMNADDDDDASGDEMGAAGDDDTSGNDTSGDDTSGGDDTSSSGGEGANEGTGGGASMVGGDGGASPQGTAGAAGMSNGEPTDPSQLEPYELREGSFSMLVYSRTTGFRHTESIATGKTLLQKIADDWDFDVVFTETNEDFTVEGLSQHELVFFLNTSGDVLNGDEETAFETWMIDHNGAFAGTHSATDTENGWAFYSEVTGQYHDLHGPAGTTDQIEFEPTAVNHPAIAGLPNPWERIEEWYLFNKHLEWSAKPGFTILGRKAADGQPIMWTREWGNFRSFYTGLGHDRSVFEGDANVEKHITGGILWAVRREHWLQ